MTTSSKTHAHSAKPAHAGRVSTSHPHPITKTSPATVPGARMTARVDQPSHAPAAAPAPTVAAPEPQAPAITSPSSARADRGKAFEYQIEATFEPKAFTADILPAGLELDEKGLISGETHATGEHRIKLGASNDVGTGSMTLTLTVA